MSSSLKILLLEDDENDAELIIRQVRQADFESQVRHVNNEADYLAGLEENYDVILSDYLLPDINARRALELLQEKGLDIPFIVVSGTIGEDTAVAMIKLGATDYILKDRMARLGQAISQAMEQSELRRRRRAAEAELLESRERFELLAGSIQDVFWIAEGEEFQITYISPAYETVWGRPTEALLKDPKAWLESIHPEDREKVLKEIYCLNPSPWPEEFRIVRPDGSVRWISDRAVAVKNPEGEVLRFVGAARDVTERRSLEEKYRQAQKMEAFGQMAAGVAHDFNNLLTVIEGNASFMQLSSLSPEEVQACSRAILEASETAATLTGQLLLFSRKKVMQRQKTDLNEVVERSIRMFGRILGADLEVHTSLALDLPPVYVDPAMIEQALLNLAVNARDAMPEGGRLSITTAHLERCQSVRPYSQEEGEDPLALCLCVGDTGSGIPEELLAHIFEPFFTTKDPGRGTGLGLATVCGIVEQHRGKLQVTSRVGEGTTFHLLLPACDGSPLPLPSTPVQAVDLPPGAETILVAEDEEPLRVLLKRVLERLGYQVYLAESGRAALEIWAKHREEIALLLTDMVMPDGLTGLALARQLSQEKPSLKVVLTSGYSVDLLSQKTPIDPHYVFLQKPYNPKTLARHLRQALDQSSP